MALERCTEVTTLKVIYNGFDVSDGSLRRVTEPIKRAVGTKLRSVHLLTTNLRKCRHDDFQEVFELISDCGAQITCEEINAQMADWEFADGYPDYHQLT